MTTDNDNTPPLWRVMQEVFANDVGEIDDGYGTIFGDPDHTTWAAELRAVADWLVPEEPNLTREEAAELVLWSEWMARIRLRDRLLAEAARAEAGE